METESLASDLKGGPKTPRGPQEEDCGGFADPTPSSSSQMGFWERGRQGGFSHYPVVVKLASDHSWSQRAGRIHGAASVMDLQWEAGVREGTEVRKGRGGVSVPLASP